MAITAASIIQRAQQLLHDTTGVRWLAPELVRWLNDGQREIVMYRPDANSRVSTATLAAGTRQDLDTTTGVTAPAKLIDVVRNMAVTSNLKGVRLVDRKLLDQQRPSWHAETPSVNIIHYTFDPRDPTAFYVYPPATTSAQLEIVYSAYPTAIDAPAGDTHSSVTGNIGVSDMYANALLDYVLYRAYAKDAEYAGTEGRARAHYAAFAASMGIEIQGTAATAPQ